MAPDQPFSATSATALERRSGWGEEFTGLNNTLIEVWPMQTTPTPNP